MTAPLFEGLASRWFLAGLLLFLLALSGALLGLRSLYRRADKAPTWAAVYSRIADDFSEVRQTSTALLADQLSTPARAPGEVPPLVIGCRSREEFARSHLPGALHLTSVDAVTAEVADHQAAIVVYCSVGLRSSALVRDLSAAGFQNVSNLEGSIFCWANERRPLVNSAGIPTTDVHPYNPRWGTLLSRSGSHSE